MSIPYVRYVSYCEDGICMYQCLDCYDFVYTTSVGGWKFCPHCGCRWKGEWECREHSVPRWAYERDGADLDPWNNWRDHKRLWLIEWRYKRANGKWSAWEPYAKQGTRPVNAIAVKGVLKHYRGDSDWDYAEYRARITSPQQAQVNRTFY